YLYCSLVSLLSFPTRRSSDLFEWFGLWICKKDHLRMERYGGKLALFAEKITLTTFGVKVLSILLEQRDLYKWNIPLRRRMFGEIDRKSTRLNSSHVSISYAVF